MNISKILPTLLGAALMLSGCSLLKRNNAETANMGDAMPLFPATTQNEEGYKAVALDGRWYVKTVGQTRVAGLEDADWPFIEFVPVEARFYGNNGCNVINGSYRTGQGQTLTLSNVAATMRFCPDDTLAFPISYALENTRSYSTNRATDGSTILSLRNDKNITIMTLRKSDIDFLNGPWQVVEINGRPCSAPDARLIFDVDGQRVSGNAGCNRLKGELTRDPQVGASVQFSNLATTRMTCPFMADESALLIALEEVHSARAKGDTVDLLTPSGQVAVKLIRLSKQDLQQSSDEPSEQ